MGAIGIILLVAFVIVCVLLVLIIMVQDDGSSGMGGLLGGRGTAAFGSHSASVLTKTTAVLTVLFFVLAFSLALLNKKPKLQQDLAPADKTAAESSTSTQSGDWWKSADTTAVPAPEAGTTAPADGTAPAAAADGTAPAADTGSTQN